MRLTKTSSTDLAGSSVLAALKNHLRVTGSWADTELIDKASKAIDYIEGQTGRQLLYANYTYSFDTFPSDHCLLLPKPPAVSITSITYIDDADASQTWLNTEYDLFDDREPALIRLAHDKVMPSGRDWVVTYKAGYGDDWGDLPANIRQCIEVVTHHYDWFRDGTPLPDGAQHLINSVRVGDGFHAYA